MTTSARVFLLALPPYFAWEMLQAPAFTGMPPGWLAATAVCAWATLGDGTIAVAVVGMGAALYQDWRWFTPPRAVRYAVVTLAGIAVHVGIEWVMVHGLHRWGYQPWHPVMPGLGVGLVPVLQPVVVLPPIFWALARTEPAPRGARR